VKEHLSSQKVTAQDINIINPDYTGLRKFECLSQIRYGSKKTKSKVTINDSRNQFQVKFNKPLIGVTPGQSVVLYDKNDRLVGGGIIDQTHSL
jgi:tRNA U34 2-thiouridine synthase MnmA/TrmU